MKRQTKIQALQRLIDKRLIYDELLSMLLQEKIVTKEYVTNEVQHLNDRAEFLYECLKKASEEDKIQMVNYNWILLPKEHIKLLVIFEKTQIEFIYE